MIQGYVEKSYSPTDEEVEKINAFTRRRFEPDSLYVFSLALCDNNIDRDYEKFSLTALEELASLFVGKTGICDHSMRAADQKARIFDCLVEKVDGKTTDDGEQLYRLKAKAYMVKTEENMPLITEIEAGIKKEVSISCSVAKCTCSICGENKKSGKCSHRNGRVYDGKKAFSVLSEVTDAYEFSFVAVPAQRDAGVTKAFNISHGEEVNMTEVIKSIRECDSELVLSKQECKELADYIDDLDDQAQLGIEYKKSLAKEVVKLCAIAMPDMDIKTFGNVAQVMTVKELLSFKEAFNKKNSRKSCKPQFSANTEKGSSNEQFKV